MVLQCGFLHKSYHLIQPSSLVEKFSLDSFRIFLLFVWTCLTNARKNCRIIYAEAYSAVYNAGAWAPAKCSYRSEDRNHWNDISKCHYACSISDVHAFFHVSRATGRFFDETPDFSWNSTRVLPNASSRFPSVLQLKQCTIIWHVYLLDTESIQ